MKFYIKILQILKGEKQKLNKRTKLLDQQLKFMHKKEQVMQDMQVEKHLYLLVAELPTVQKDSQIIRKEN